MSTYIFETMTVENAANFNGAADQIIFADPNSTAYTIAVSHVGGLNLTTLTTLDGLARTFPGAQLKAASEAGRIHFGDARQGLRDGEIGERRVLRDALGKLHAFAEAVACIDEVGG